MKVDKNAKDNTYIKKLESTISRITEMLEYTYQGREFCRDLTDSDEAEESFNENEKSQAEVDDDDDLDDNYEGGNNNALATSTMIRQAAIGRKDTLY